MPSILSLMDQAIKDTGQWANEISEGTPFSPSSIFTGKKCGLQYWFRYIKKQKIPPRAAWVWGGAGHAAIAVDLEVKRKTGGESVELKDLIELFESTFEERFSAVEKRSETKPLPWLKDDFMDKGRRLLRKFKLKGEPSLHPHPDRIEHRLDYPLEIRGKDGGPEIIVITNHIDLITKEPNIVDHKFKSRTPPRPLFAPLQLVSYALAYEYNFKRLPKEVRRDDYIALKTKETIVSQIITRESLDQQARMSLVLDVQQIKRMADAGIFHLPERGVYPCTPEWCGYWNFCPYGSGGKVAPKGLALP
jgi:PD-(D/E)XK nuclease superfamily